MRKSVIVMEFNELSPPLMEKFIAQGYLPNFKKLRSESQTYITQAAEQPPYLDPWIQWVTVHAGVDFAEHGIEHLNEGHKLKQKNVWDILSQRDFPVWVCGSMSVRYENGLKGIVMPDPWTTKVSPSKELEPFFKFIQQNVLEYTNDRVPLKKLDYAKFIAFMAQHGLSVSTVKAIVEQLGSELRNGNGRWKRATLLDKLQFDVFRYYWKKVRPAFSTFFSNSTAHFQHLYWRNMQPELFKVKPTEDEQLEYEDAILYGYKEMDATIGRFMKLAGGDTTLIFTTALSQQPCLKFEDDGGKSSYRPRDFVKFVQAVGLPASAKAAPVMSEQFYLEFATETDALFAEAVLRSMKINGRDAMVVQREGLNVFTGCTIWDKLDRETILTFGHGQSLKFFDLFYNIEGMKSGMHHPDGLLWIRRPDREHAVHAGRVPLASVAPTILDMFSVSKPAFMRAAPLGGFSKLVN
jgi:hypothetical protein